MNKRLKKKKGFYDCEVCGSTKEYWTGKREDGTIIKSKTICVNQFEIYSDEEGLHYGPDKNHRDAKDK